MIKNMTKKLLIYLFLFNKLILGQNTNKSLIIKLCGEKSPPLALDDNSDVPNLNTNNDLCFCQMQDSEPWGLTYLTIECNNKQWNDTIFKVTDLPEGAEFLDLSWNNFKYIPFFKGDRLKELILSNNKLISVDEENFIGVNNLTKLDLSQNLIERISLKAFINIENLQKLYLSQNQLKILNPTIFSHLPNLKELILSDNDLSKSMDNTSELHTLLGITPNLETLEMSYCNLRFINIRQMTGLKRLILRSNNFFTFPDIPRNVEFLDLSGNPIEIFSARMLPHLYKLHTLYMEDMPKLIKIDNYSLFGYPKLEHLNLQGSKSLTYFSEYAFGLTVIQNETDTVLKTINLRGTNIKYLNDTLKFAFENVKQIDLAGAPIFCDCDVLWIKEKGIETNARCDRPTLLSGRLLSSVPDYQLTCVNHPSWIHILMNVILILCLITLAGVALYLIYSTVKPMRRKRFNRKLGLSSPYARITTEVLIDPNRAENHV